jgi:hypothetical protein
MNKRILVIALATVLLSSGCANNSSPEKVLRSFLQKIEDKEYDAAAKLATQNSQATIEGFKKNAKQVTPDTGPTPEEEIYSPVKGKWKFELEKAKITGDLATIVVKTFRSGDEERYSSAQYSLEKENGEWKVMMVPSPRAIHYLD